MKRQSKAVICLSVLAALLLLCFAVWRAGEGSQAIPIEEGASILTISRVQRDGGPIMDLSTTGNKMDEIDGLSASLLECLAGYSMARRPVTVDPSMDIGDPYDHVSIWLQNPDRPSFRVNVSSVDAYSYVTYQGKNFMITDPAPLLRELDVLLDGVMDLNLAY